MKLRTAAVLLLAIALLTTLGWTTDSCGQAKIPRVGAALPDRAGRPLRLVPRSEIPGLVQPRAALEETPA